MAEKIGEPLGQRIETILRQKGIVADVPDGVGKLRIRNLGGMIDSQSIKVEGRLNGVKVNEELELSNGRHHNVVYVSGTVFQSQLPNLQVLSALEAIAKVNRSDRFLIPFKKNGGQYPYGIALTGEMTNVLAAVGYSELPAWEGNYLSKGL